MKSINIILPSLTFSSFAYVGRITKILIENLNTNTIDPPVNVTLSTSYRHGYLNIRIDDLVLTLKHARYCDIAWLDTALDMQPPSPRVLNSPAKIYVCGEYDRQKCLKYNVKVLDVVPRPFNPIAYAYRYHKYDKKYDVMVIGWYDNPDRKNFEIANKIVTKLGLKAVAITNYKGNWHRIDFSSIDDFEKFKLLAKSKYLLHLSGQEGFGMPPLEAMAVGTPVIYLDAPVHNEFSIGFKIPVRDTVVLNHKLGKITCRKPDVDEAIDIVKQALDLYNTDTYRELSHLCMLKSDQMLGRVIGWLNEIVK